MSVAGLEERILFFTRQRNLLTKNLADCQAKIMSCTRRYAERSQEFNESLKALYYDPEIGRYNENDPYIYFEKKDELEVDFEFDTTQLQAWESRLDLEKESLETQLNVITNSETSFNKLLKENIKNGFSYGASGGK